MENYTIIQDNREKLPLSFGKQAVEVNKLDVGDYACKWNNLILPVVFERKSALDLFSTLGKGHERFKREIMRGINQKLDIYVIIEENYTNIKLKKFDKAFRSRMRGYVTTKIAHTLEVKYGVRFIFANNRAESAAIIRGIFDAMVNQVEKEIKAYTKSQISLNK